MLLEEYRPDLLDSYATATLPLILCISGKYEALAIEFASQQAAENRKRLLQLFGQLMVRQDGSTPLCLDRFSRREFKSNLKSFVTNARGFMQVK